MAQGVVDGLLNDAIDGGGQVIAQPIKRAVQGERQARIGPLVTSGHCLACRRGDDMHAEESRFPGINADVSTGWVPKPPTCWPCCATPTKAC